MAQKAFVVGDSPAQDGLYGPFQEVETSCVLHNDNNLIVQSCEMVTPKFLKVSILSTSLLRHFGLFHLAAVAALSSHMAVLPLIHHCFRILSKGVTSQEFLLNGLILICKVHHKCTMIPDQ